MRSTIFSAVFSLFMMISPAFAGDIVGTVFYADWCGSCKVLDPKVNEARKDPALNDVEFIVLDMTNAETRNVSIERAKENGLDILLQTYGAATGFLVVYDREQDKIIDVIRADNSVEEIISTFNQAQQG